MPATSKDELLQITQKEFGKLETLIADCDAAIVLAKDEEDTSIKDVVAHRAHWIELFFGWYEDGLAGKDVSFPAEGYKWNELKRYNADLRARQARLSWGEAVDELKSQHERLAAFISARSETELYEGPLVGAKNDWKLGRWAEATGASHYRSASKYIRARKKALAAAD